MEKTKDTKVSIGFGCLTDIIAMFLFFILLDLLGCDCCNGFTEKVKGIFKSDSTTQQIHPSDLR